jgi:hypothetical protein
MQREMTVTTKTQHEDQDQKREWVKPHLDRLEAIGAESSHGNIPDGGGGNQGS